MSSFHLDTALAAWRRSLTFNPAFSEDDLDELEAHLRDEVSAGVAAGMTPETALTAALREMGDHERAEAEYQKVYWRKRRQHGELLSEVAGRIGLAGNYITVAFRHLRRKKGYTVINVFGLAVGMACCLAVAFFVRDEVRYDTYHDLGDRIYRLSTDATLLATNEVSPSALSSILWGPALLRDYPDIQAHARFVPATTNGPFELIRGERRFEETNLIFADPAALELFSWPLLAGDPATALVEPNSLVLTASMAAKYFGEADPVGQILTVDPKLRGPDGQLTGQVIEAQVTGVMDDVPHRSHFTFDALVSMATFAPFIGGDVETGAGVDPWHWRGRIAHTYLLLDEQADVAALEGEFPAFLEQYVGDATRSRGYNYTLLLQPLPEIYLGGQRGGQLAPVGDEGQLVLFSFVALFVLLIACVNFINLSTAYASRRAKEVGMRKVIGARPRQLMGQFLSEAVLLSGLAVGLGLALTLGALPALYGFIGREFVLGSDAVAVIGLSVVGITLLVGLLAGSYPAFVLSAFRPIRVLKGVGERVRGQRLRKGLVVGQFALSTLFIVATVTTFYQLQHMRSHALGFDAERLLVLEADLSQSIGEGYDAFRTELLRHPQVADVTAASGTPGRSFGGELYNERGASAESGQAVYELSVEPTFGSVFGLDLVAGRFPSESIATDVGFVNDDGQWVTSLVINETLVRRFGWASPEEAVGKEIVRDPNAVDLIGVVVGVVRDFHVESLREPIQPFVLLTASSRNHIVVKLAPGAVDEPLAFVQAAAQRFAPAAPFGYTFVDDNFQALYEEETRIGRVFGYVSALAVLIACMGLFGLAAFTTDRRTKEIGVRKVLGASVPGIVGLLSKEFLSLVAVAFVLGALPAYYVVQRGLADFAYRVDLGVEVFLLTALLLLTTAVLAVSVQSVKAALANPIKSLRYE
ncbi:MAG: ABC transporter permease [Bacteroidota bacterium]